jgi:hypothetical protein
MIVALGAALNVVLDAMFTTIVPCVSFSGLSFLVNSVVPLNPSGFVISLLVNYVPSSNLRVS